MSDIEKKRFIYSLVFPTIFLFLIWFTKFAEFGLQEKFTFLGIYPLEIKGLIGIITSPFIHADINHLFDNSVPLFFLSLALIYFYRDVAYKVFFLIYFITGTLVWIFGREAYHIGASGIIYGLAAFLFLSGIIRRNRNLMAISMLVIFLYGSLVWGLFPFDYKISWESHLMGAITGVTTAILFRHEGPLPDTYSLPEDDNDSDHLADDEDEQRSNINFPSDDKSENI
jgi:membrane associated rhomboid family serine protease